MPTVLAISPHLDDAVFSAGGTLARRARHGWRVVVATVFTASVANPRGFALACQLDKGLAADVDYMALRREEDSAACAILGAEPVWLPFPEAPHRGYASAPMLFGDMNAGDRIVDAITPALATLVDDLDPDEMFAPQAIGGHVDHVAVYEAVRTLRRPLRLWADFPYSARPAPKPSPFVTDLADLPRAMVALGPDEVRAKVDAAVTYESQLGFQFGGATAARAFIAGAGATEIFAG